MKAPEDLRHQKSDQRNLESDVAKLGTSLLVLTHFTGKDSTIGTNEQGYHLLFPKKTTRAGFGVGVGGAKP